MSSSIKKTLSKIQDILSMIQSHAELPTWLAIGMFLQTIAFGVLPGRVAAAPAVLFLMYKIVYMSPKSREDNPYLKDVRAGRWTATVPNEDGKLAEKPGNVGVTCFIVGVQINHPLGLLAPGLRETGAYFNAMWAEAEANTKESGLLSSSYALTAQNPGKGNILVRISYWRSLDHLRNFAAHGSHAKGRRWWEQTRKQWGHLGIFHEAYVVPAGNYETIYENFMPFGLGQIGNGKGFNSEMMGENGALRKADGREWRSMDSRMGQVDKSNWQG